MEGVPPYDEGMLSAEQLPEVLGRLKTGGIPAQVRQRLSKENYDFGEMLIPPTAPGSRPFEFAAA